VLAIQQSLYFQQNPPSVKGATVCSLKNVKKHHKQTSNVIFQEDVNKIHKNIQDIKFFDEPKHSLFDEFFLSHPLAKAYAQNRLLNISSHILSD